MRWRKNQIGAEFLTKLFRPGSQHLRGATLVKFGDINARCAASLAAHAAAHATPASEPHAPQLGPSARRPGSQCPVDAAAQ